MQEDKVYPLNRMIGMFLFAPKILIQNLCVCGVYIFCFSQQQTTFSIDNFSYSSLSNTRTISFNNKLAFIDRIRWFDKALSMSQPIFYFQDSYEQSGYRCFCAKTAYLFLNCYTKSLQSTSTPNQQVNLVLFVCEVLKNQERWKHLKNGVLRSKSQKLARKKKFGLVLHGWCKRHYRYVRYISSCPTYPI